MILKITRKYLADKKIIYSVGRALFLVLPNILLSALIGLSGVYALAEKSGLLKVVEYAYGFLGKELAGTGIDNMCKAEFQKIEQLTQQGFKDEAQKRAAFALTETDIQKSALLGQLVEELSKKASQKIQ